MTTEQQDTATEDGYEFDAEELESRAKTIVAVNGGPTWHLTDSYDEVVKLKENASEVGGDVECHAHQDGGLPPSRVSIDPTMIASVFEITEDRWKADRLARHMQEKALREAQARGGIAMPPAMPGGGLPLN